MSLFGVLAHPASHELLKKVHLAGYKAIHMHADFRAFDVPPEKLDRFFEKIKEERVCLSVSYPYKETIAKYCSEVSVAAKNIGAINTLYFREGKLIGHNTEFLGIRKPLLERCDLEDKTMVVLGAGPVARAAIYAGVMSGAHVTVLDEDDAKAKKLAMDFSCEYGSLEEYRRSNYDVIVQTTSKGMKGEESILGNDYRFHKNQIVFDCVYSPLMTPLLEQAENVGADIITGDKMFLVQAYEQFKFFTGKDAPKEAMRKAFLEALKEGVEYD
jgi:shikimate dehydrogenase